jgi:Ca2+-binding RTX toxin-like protein
MQAPHVATGSLRLHEGAARRPTLARRAALALATATLASLALAAPAQADTTIGQTGGEPGGCQGPFVYADTTYVVPAGGGQITDFSFESNSASPGGGFPGNDGQQLDFLVLRPAGGSNYTVVGKTGLVTLRGTGLETFPVNIRVQGGDILGVWIPSFLPYCVRSTVVGFENEIISLGAPDPNVGDTVSLGQPALGTHLNESANLVPPRCQGQDATIVGTGGSDSLRGTSGDDVIAARGGDDTVVGLQGDDVVCGSGGADVIRGKGGDDVLRAGEGDDQVAAGGGDDEVQARSGDDAVAGGSGNDLLRGGGGGDELRGKGDDDELRGGTGNDVHRGGGGTDVCRGGGGSDRKRQC